MTSDFWASRTWCVHAIDKSVAIEWIFLGGFIWCVSVSPPVSIVSRKAVWKWRWCTLILMLIYYIFFPAGIYLLKVNKRNTRTRCETCSKLTIRISERRQTSYFTLYSSVSTVNFEHVIDDWVIYAFACWEENIHGSHVIV